MTIVPPRGWARSQLFFPSESLQITSLGHGHGSGFYNRVQTGQTTLALVFGSI